MPVKLTKRNGIWYYNFTVAGRRFRGSAKTTDKTIAARQAAKLEARAWESHLSGPSSVLTFAQAAIKYRAAGKSDRHLAKIEDYWRDTLVRDITVGAIQQSAIVLFPNVSGATRNRHVVSWRDAALISLVQARIRNRGISICGEASQLGMCAELAAPS